MLVLLLAGCNLEAPGNPGDPTPFIYEVPAGASARGLAGDLAQLGLVQSAWKWQLWVRMEGGGTCLKAGRHEVRRNMTAPELLDALCGVPIPKDEPFTVVEGWRAREIDAALAAKGWIEAGEYLALVAQPGRFQADFPLPTDTLEGYLYPETYKIEPDRFEPEALIRRQLDTFAARFWADHQGELGGRSLHEVVVMASMLEREEPDPKLRPLVAGILWKRIEAGWNLGVDATSRYTLDDWNDRQAFLKKLRDPQDPYNTRLRPGLPPTAIGNPAAPSLVAAIRPEPSEFWFYLHDADRTLRASRTEAEHEAKRRQYDVW